MSQLDGAGQSRRFGEHCRAGRVEADKLQERKRRIKDLLLLGFMQRFIEREGAAAQKQTGVNA